MMPPSSRPNTSIRTSPIPNSDHWLSSRANPLPAPPLGMSSIKSLLKSAREAIDRADYPTALRLCDMGLVEDDRNYLLLVFRAVALQNLGHSPQAVECYRLAASLQPHMAPAWQGLVGLLEKEQRLGEAIEPLQKLAVITEKNADANKNLEYNKKLLGALEGSGRLEDCVELLKWMQSKDATTRYDGLDAHLKVDGGELMGKEIALTERLEEERSRKEIEIRRYRLGADPLPILREKVYAEIYATSHLDKVMFKYLERDGDNLELAEKLMDRLLKKIPVVREFDQTRSLLDIAHKYRDRSDLAQAILLDFCDYESLGFQVPDTHLGPYGQAGNVTAMGEQQLVDELGQKHADSLFVGLVVLREFWSRKELLHTQVWVGNARERAKRLTERYGFQCEQTQRLLRRVEGSVFAQDQRCEEAIRILEEFQDERAASEMLITCYSRVSMHEAAIRVYRRLLEQDPTDVNLLQGLGWEHYLCRDFPNAQTCLEKALSQKFPSEACRGDVLNRLGRVMWDSDENNRRDKSGCLQLFLSAAKANPHHAEPFLYLGHYYSQVEGDTGRAEKCYAKALQLDCDCIEAALEISLLWLGVIKCKSPEAPETKEVLQRIIRVLEPFSDLHFRNARLWMYLGMALSAMGKHPSATTAFQNALKGDHPQVRRCLLGLADGYRRQGRYTAALKAYDRVLKMDPSCQMALVGLAAVYGKVGEFCLARKTLLEGFPADTASLWIQVEVLRYGSEEFFELVKLACTEKALSLLEELIRLSLGILKNCKEDFRKAACITWKILSDLCVRGAVQLWEKIDGSELVALLKELQEHLVGEFSGDEIWDGIEAALPPALPSILLVMIKISCLSQINLIVEYEEGGELSSAWSDLATSLFIASSFGGESRELLLIAKDCAEQAASSSSLGSSSAAAWTILGITSLRLDALGAAQHYLIHALHCDAQHWGAWLALSHLYYTMGDEELATLAAGAAQLGAGGTLGWVYQLLIDQKSSEAQSKSTLLALKHITEQADPSLHPIHYLYALEQLGVLKQKLTCADDNADLPEIISRIKVAVLQRLAFIPNDPLAQRLISVLPGEEVGEPTRFGPAISKMSAEELCAMVEGFLAKGTTTEEAGTSTIQEISSVSPWMSSLSFAKQGKAAEAFEVQLSRFTPNRDGGVASFHCPSLWGDLHFWYERLVPLDREVVEQRAREWLRMIITPELAERLFSLAALQAIKHMWGEAIPGDLNRILSNNQLFLSQHAQVQLIKSRE